MLNVDFSNWVDVATVVGGFATALAAAFAVVGIPLAIAQIRAARAIQREATAKSLYRQYLQDAISHPTLVLPDYAALVAQGEKTRYELFVAHMLFSLEEILANTKGADWEDVVLGQLRRHTDYLSSDDFATKRRYYDAELLDLVDRATSEARRGATVAPI